MRTALINILVIAALVPTRAMASWDWIDDDRRSSYEAHKDDPPSPPDTRTEEEKRRELLNYWKNDLLTSRGEWLNASELGVANPDAEESAEEIRAIVREYIEKKPELAKLPIRVHVYKNHAPNAWVARFNPKQERFSFGQRSRTDVKALSKALGHDPEKGFIELGITTALFATLDTDADLAFIVGHELGHVAEGHLKDQSTIALEDIWKGWFEGHVKEFAADAVGVELAAGLYDVNAAVNVISKLSAIGLGSQTKRGPLAERVGNALESALSTHPHEGVRIAALEANVRLTKGKISFNPKAKSLSPAMKRLGRLIQVQEGISDWFKKNLSNMFNGADERERDRAEGMISSGLKLKSTSTAELSELLDTLSHDPKRKLKVFLDILYNSAHLEHKSADSEDGQGHEVLAKIARGGHLGRVNQWLTQIDEQGQKELIESLTVRQRMHSFLLAVSGMPTEKTKGPSGFDKFALKYFEKTLDSFMLLKFNATSDDKIEGDLRDYGSPQLRRSFLNLALERMRHYNTQNVAAFAAASRNSRRLKLAGKEGYGAIDAYSALFDFIAELTAMPEAGPLRLELRSRVEKLRAEIIDSVFRGYQFPEARSVDIKMKYNPGSDHPMAVEAGAPDHIPDYSHPPFIQLQWLKLLSSRQVDAMSADLSKFLGGVAMLRAGWGEITAGVAESYRADYDELIAETWLRRYKDLSDPDRVEFLSQWHSMRRTAGPDVPILRPETRQAVSESLREISDDVIVKYHSGLWAFDLLHSLGRTQAIFEKMSLKGMQEFLVVTETKGISLSMPVLDEAMTALANKKSMNVDQAKDWLATMTQILTLKRSRYSPSPKVIELLRKESEIRLRMISSKDALELMKNAKLRDVFGNTIVAGRLKDEVLKRVRAARNARGAKLTEILIGLEKELGLEEATSITHDYRDLVAKELRIQPEERVSIDPHEGKTWTGLGSGSGELVRSFSGLLSAIRELPLADQLEFVQYISGRSTRIPLAIVKLNDEIKSTQHYTGRSLIDWAQAAADKMSGLSESSRALVIHSFMTGPSGILSTPEGLAKAEALILAQAPKGAAKETRLILSALKASEGREYGLLLSYALAQKQTGAGASGAAGFLKALLESFGVPGIKFGQFLAFSSQFSEYRQTFDSFQDAALPISYISMLKLLEKHLGVEWNPLRFEVVGIKGTGSVKIAIEVRDRQTGHNRILNVLRHEIETQAQYDFARFQSFVAELVKLDKSSGLAFISGVALLVEDSVSSEFDMARAKEMHALSEVQYSHKVGDWQVKSVHVDEVFGRGLVMDVAPGESARSVLKSDPFAYRASVGAFLSVAEYRLRGLGPDGKPTNGKILTDPDIHNGQLFIDKRTRTITLLDKGQASAATLEERELGRVLLRFASQTTTPAAFAKELKKFETMLELKLAPEHLTHFTEIQKLPQLMDRYLNVLGYLRGLGHVPRAVVNWGFEFYRVRELAAQIDPLKRTKIDAILLGAAPGAVVRAGIGAVEAVQKTPRPTLLPKAQAKSVGALTCEALFSR